MNNQTQMRDMVKLGATPEYMIGSVHAVTEDGNGGDRIQHWQPTAGYAASAAHVVWVVGTQKIVSDLDEAIKRIYEYTFPLEDDDVLYRHTA